MNKMHGKIMFNYAKHVQVSTSNADVRAKGTKGI